MDMNSKEYQNYVKDYTINQIKERYGLKTKKEAEQWFWKAISYNIVQSSIFEQITFLRENEKEEVK